MDGGRERNEIWHKGSLGDEDDSRTSNTRILQSKRAIQHSTMKMHRNIIQCVVITLTRASVLRRQHQPEAKPEAFALNLGNDQSRYLCPKSGLFKSHNKLTIM